LYGGDADGNRHSISDKLDTEQYMAVEQLKGFVLHTYNLTESSKIVVLLTPERGKVRAVAKGVRRTKSKFGSSLEPLTYVEVQVHFKEGRDLQNLYQAETRDAFPEIRSDLRRLGLASLMCELMEQFVQENEEAGEYFFLLAASLKLLSGMSRNYNSLLIFFYLKLLDISGLLPDFSRCARELAAVVGLLYPVTEAGGLACGQYFVTGYLCEITVNGDDKLYFAGKAGAFAVERPAGTTVPACEGLVNIAFYLFAFADIDFEFSGGPERFGGRQKPFHSAVELGEGFALRTTEQHGAAVFQDQHRAALELGAPPCEIPSVTDVDRKSVV